MNNNSNSVPKKSKMSFSQYMRRSGPLNLDMEKQRATANLNQLANVKLSSLLSVDTVTNASKLFETVYNDFNKKVTAINSATNYDDVWKAIS